jgi:hypothetical protein
MRLPAIGQALVSKTFPLDAGITPLHLRRP